MSYNYNQVILVGRLTRDPDVLDVKNRKRSSFILAVRRHFRKNQNQTESDFIPIIAWGQLAELSSQYLKKGSPVLAAGRIQVRSYLEKDQLKWITEVVAERIQFLGPPKEKMAG